MQKYFASTGNRVINHRLEMKNRKFRQDMQKNLLMVGTVSHFEQNACRGYEMIRFYGKHRCTFVRNYLNPDLWKRSSLDEILPKFLPIAFPKAFL